MLPLFTFFGMVLGLIFVTRLSSNLVNTYINAANGQIYYWYECDYLLYAKDDTQCKGSVTGIVEDAGMGLYDSLPPTGICKYNQPVGTYHKYINCKFIECGKLNSALPSGIEVVACPAVSSGSATLTPTPPSTSVTPTRRPSPTPVGFTGGGCGASCTSTSQCQSGFSCMDIDNDPGSKCWNEAQCGGPALKSRIEGVVRGCNNEKLAGIPVWAWGNVDYTDQNGKFQLNKGVNRNSEGDITLNETSILAGNDALKNTEIGYFDNATGRQFDALQLRSGNSCGLVNCNFRSYIGDSIGISNNHKLMVGGPTRTAYRIQSMADALFEYNFVFTDYHAGQFNFKKINCPTTIPPTLTPPPLLSCNSNCTSSAQCANINPNWFCSSRGTNSSWSNRVSEFVSTGNGLISSGKITGMNNHTSADGTTLEQHVVKNNQLYYRSKPIAQTGWTVSQSFQNHTSYVSEVGCSALNYIGDACTNFKNQFKIIDFNTYITGAGVKEQHLLRSNGTYTYIFSRNNQNGWSSWIDVSSNFSGVGSKSGANNVITSFSSFMTYDGYKMQTFVRGSRVYQRQIGLYNWIDSSSAFTACTTNGSCGLNPSGSNPIIAYKQSRLPQNKVVTYLVRKDGLVYWMNSLITEKRCRLKSQPWNATCGATPTLEP